MCKFITMILLLTLTLYGSGEVFDILNMPITPKINAIGNAYASLPANVVAFEANPAGLVRIKHNTISLNTAILMMDMYSYAGGYVYRINDNNVLQVSLYGITYGNTPRTTVSNPLPTEGNTFSGRDIVSGIGYGTTLFSKNNKLGLKINMVTQVVDDVTGVGLFCDVGYMRKITDNSFNVGVLIKNIPILKPTFDSKQNRTPFVIKTGMSYKPIKNLLLAMDINKPVYDRLSINFGCEYNIFDILFLRVGYNSYREIGFSLNSGFGINYQNITVDYSLVPFGDFGLRHNFGLSFKFI